MLWNLEVCKWKLQCILLFFFQTLQYAVQILYFFTLSELKNTTFKNVCAGTYKKKQAAALTACVQY